MWIYYHASFGPEHQSKEYGFKHFHESYDKEDIKSYLFHYIDSNRYSIVLNFWEVDSPSSKHVNNKIESTKEEIKELNKHLKMLESTSCFVPEEKEGKDTIIIRNLKKCIDTKLLKRLHKAGFMYCYSDLSNWRYGKKYPTEPKRTKILKIMRSLKNHSNQENHCKQCGK
ncbi:MAG: hypothetical protein J7L15_00805 [Clostridiales bacterium]|nr:hypothetical protein [Clostridiales bacterium]